MREAHRLHKHCLVERAGTYFLIAYIYIGIARSCDFQTLQGKMIASFHYLNKLPTQNNHGSSQT